MPRTIHPELLDCLRRANPFVELRTEISVPDVGVTYRRSDQFTGAARVSLTPASSMVVSANGALTLSTSSSNLADFPGVGGTANFDLNREDPGRRVKGLSWLVDPAFVRATLRTFTARVGRAGIAASFGMSVDFELQIYRVMKTPGATQAITNSQVVSATAFTQYTFRQLLSSAAIYKAANVVWVANRATLVFDLSQYGVVVDNSPSQAAAPDQVGELPVYIFVVRAVNAPTATGLFFWLQDLVTSSTVAGVGTFSKVFWARDSDSQQWSSATSNTQPPSSTITFESFATTSAAVYSVDHGRAPAAGTVGRVVFERSLPPGTTALLEISTAGSGGPWTAIKHGDAPALAQQTYHLRLTLTSDTPNHRASPGVSAIGIEYRTPTDITVESILTLPSREIATPFLSASIAEARVKVLRMGMRDYLDVATSLGSTQSTPKLEAEVYLASRHPSITRDKWLRLDRMSVTSRTPSALAEDFTLLSYASKLKRKIPGKVETINTVHIVQAGSDATKIIVSPNLKDVPVGDNTLYDGKRYYMRVQRTTGTSVPQGYTQEIQGNTGQAQIDFTPNLLAALVTGDTIEIHSGIFNTKAIIWVDYDPADSWWEILTTHLDPPIPPERVGQGFLPRGGRPPHVTDRAPGDAATQAKLKITNRLTDQEDAYELLDQLSFIMGGATVEIDGQICFVQIYPLRALDGTISVPLPPVAAVFDIRDYAGLATPSGLEERATVLSANYGVNKAAAAPDAFPSKTTVIVDNDALQWLTKQDLEDVGSSEMPDGIARWLYNSPASGGDEGLYLATQVGSQVVRAISTGKRVFSFTAVEAQPQLVPGDPIILITDAYTDYDPGGGIPIKGWLAIRGVTVRVGNQGRSLAAYILGLAENVTQINGGAAGALTGLGTQPAQPSIGGSFTADGELVLSVDGDTATAYQKIAISLTGVPSAATVRATAAIAGQSIAGLHTGVFIAPGHPVWISAFSYSATDLESAPVASRELVRQGGAFDPHRGPWWHLREEEGARTGAGGYGVPRQRYRSEPYYDDTGFNPLLDPVARRVGPLLQGNDGEPGIESQRAATRKGAQAAGHGAHGISEEEAQRGNAGGYGVPGQRYRAEPYMDSSGSVPLIDPVTRRIQTGALGPTGVGMGTIEDGGQRGYDALEIGGVIAQATTQRNGTNPKNIASGRYAIGTGTHTQSITFPANYQNPPAINILGGISYQPASLWGTAGNADANPQTGTSAPNASAQVDEVVAYNVTASTASLRARLRQASATTARSNAYAAGQITTNGGTLEATTANAPAANDTYTTDFTVQFTSTAVPGKACNVSGTVALDYWNGSVWTQVASATYTASDPVGGAADTGLISDTLVATVSGLTATSKFRVRLVTNAGAGTRTYSVDPGNVTYTTTTGDQYTSKTPASLGINLSVEVIGAS